MKKIIFDSFLNINILAIYIENEVKKIFTLLIFVLLLKSFGRISAQYGDSTVKGFIGISAGISSLNYSRSHPNPGLRINIDAGYKLSRVFGISALLAGAAHVIETEHSVPSPRPGNPYFKTTEFDKDNWYHGSFLIGPLFSIPVGKNSFNISPLSGISAFMSPEYDRINSSLAFDLNTNFTFRSDRKVAFRMAGDFFIGGSAITVSLGLGLNYRFFQ